MAFRFDYRPGTIRYGEGCVADLGDELAALDARRALVVTGRTVGTTSAVMDPIREGLGDRLVETFAETTPEKRLSTAIRTAERARAVDADAFVAVGGGSSLDVAKIAAVVAAAEDPRSTIRERFLETGSLAAPPGELRPVVAVPTTLAGADLSMVAGISAREDDADGSGDGDGREVDDDAADGDDAVVRGGAYDERLMPSALLYDPALFRTTPHEVLCASAMNGLDKAIETLYARTRTPITDGTATRALRLLADGLPALGAGERDGGTMHDAVVGTVLAQYGCSRADGLTLSLLHAFGHGVSRGFDAQQGAAHAIVAPHALRFLFDRVDGRRDRIAEGLGVDRVDAGSGDGGADAADEAVAEAVVAEVAAIRDALGLPSQLRSIDDVAESDLPDVARAVHQDGLMPNCPAGLDPTVADLESVLREAW